MKTLGERLEELMKANEWKVSYVAKKVGIDRSYLSRMMSGERPWSLPKVKQVADFFGMTVEDLVRDTDQEGMARAPEVAQDALQRAQGDLAELRTEVDAVRAEIEPLRAENDSLLADLGKRPSPEVWDATQAELTALRSRMTALQDELRVERQARVTAEEKEAAQRLELAQVQSQLKEAQREKQRLAGEKESTLKLAKKANEKAERYRQALIEIQNNLNKAQDAKAKTNVFAVLAGLGLLGALASTASKK